MTAEQKKIKQREKSRKRYSRIGHTEKYRDRKRKWARERRGLPKVVFNHYKADAKFRGLSFELSKEQVMSMIGKKCTYCGEVLQKIGIDRVDNELGYTIENSVPCCTICNLMKRTLPKEVFIAQCEKITNQFIRRP